MSGPVIAFLAVVVLVAALYVVGLLEDTPDQLADERPAVHRPAPPTDDVGDDDEGEWDSIAEFLALAGQPDDALSMDGLLAYRTRVREFLALVSTFGPSPTAREVEDLLLDEGQRLDAAIAERLLTDATTDLTTGLPARMERTP